MCSVEPKILFYSNTSEPPVHCGVLSQANNVRRGRGRPKSTWEEAIKRDLKAWDIPRDLCLNRSACKAAIDD